MSAPAQLTLPAPPLVLGIAGCSGSGKTTLARELACELNATLLPLDLYYRDLAHLPAEDRARQNFDHPDSLEHELLAHDVRALASGRSIQAPVYDFTTHTRVADRSEPVPASAVLIVEGILALHYEDLLPAYHLSVFVDAPHEVCLNRRIHRDVNERGRTEASVREQYWATAHPMAERFVVPSASNAMLTVDGCSSLDWSVEQILGTLRRSKLLPKHSPHAGTR